MSNENHKFILLPSKQVTKYSPNYYSSMLQNILENSELHIASSARSMITDLIERIERLTQIHSTNVSELINDLIDILTPTVEISRVEDAIIAIGNAAISDGYQIRNSHSVLHDDKYSDEEGEVDIYSMFEIIYDTPDVKQFFMEPNFICTLDDNELSIIASFNFNETKKVPILEDNYLPLKGLDFF